MTNLESGIQILEELKTLAVPFLKKLGHKIPEWKLGPNPNRRLCYTGECSACGQTLACQRSMANIGGKVTNRWEITVGSFVLAESYGDDLTTLNKIETNQCKRFSNLE